MHRRPRPLARVLVALVAIGVGPALAPPAALAQQHAAHDQAAHARVAPVSPVSAVVGVAITVADLDRAVEWYGRVLDARLVSTTELAGDEFARLVGAFGARARVATLRIGDEQVQLTQFLTPAGRPFPADTRSNDRWFQHIAIIVRDMDEAYARLRDLGVPHASTLPQRLPDWNPGAGGIKAFYFRDPDGHFLEILQFPPGKGDPRWQSTSALFLGIDHTAIVVDDTDAALRYYRDHLGMTVAGAGENYGVEQEHLNAVFGARLRITALRAPRGPAVELLEYLTPRDGRPMPIDSRPTDLWHWHILMETPSPDAMFDACRAAGGSPVSPGAQLVRAAGADAPAPALMARDPDGHAILFTTPTPRRTASP